MTNGGEKGSSSSNPNPTRPNPIRINGIGRQNDPPPPPPPPPPRFRALPRQRPPPIMGIPGVSSFTPYNQRARPAPPPPPPPPPHPPPPPRSSAPTRGSGSRKPTGPGTGSCGFAGFQGGQAVLVGGSSHGGAPATALRIGGNPASRKRGTDGGPVAGAGNQAVGPGEGGVGPVRCSVCGKEFMSAKALFGHMRSHPERGWKGAHPPPAFRADEEFADLRPLYQPEAPAAAPEGGETAQGEGGAGGEERMEAAEGARNAEEEQGGGEREHERRMNLPDLNEIYDEAAKGDDENK